tara:strand:+ start:256 stop:450 length:195 start_codon:yes stop_codon:yes gene_type:complete
MNGKKIYIKNKIYIQKFIEDWIENFEEKKIAVSLNNEIITREKWPKVKLNDKDTLEIVMAFPGG